MVISPAVGSFIYAVYGRYAVFATSCVVASLDIVYIMAVVPESLESDIMARRYVASRLRARRRRFCVQASMRSFIIVRVNRVREAAWARDLRVHKRTLC
jgi:hypothetical protein